MRAYECSKPWHIDTEYHSDHAASTNEDNTIHLTVPLKWLSSQTKTIGFGSSLIVSILPAVANQVLLPWPSGEKKEQGISEGERTTSEGERTTTCLPVWIAIHFNSESPGSGTAIPSELSKSSAIAQAAAFFVTTSAGVRAGWVCGHVRTLTPT